MKRLAAALALLAAVSPNAQVSSPQRGLPAQAVRESGPLDDAGQSGRSRPDLAKAGLTGAAQLARIYDTIFDARFDQAALALEKSCASGRHPGSAVRDPSDARPGVRTPIPDPGARTADRGSQIADLLPSAVCLVVEAVSLWWQIQLDPADESRDELFLQRVNVAIDAAAAWTIREPLRAEAWFYLGGAYGARVQVRVLRGEQLAAARDGKRIKDSLEHALQLDPDLHDAWFGIGLYHYYADVAPAATRILRWLLFLPGGDRVKGLEEMLRARDRGALLRSEADYQLHVIDLWYEQRSDRALELLRGLRQRHPQNPHFPQLIAEVEDVYHHDLTASLRSWQSLLDAATARRVMMPGMAEARARLGLALQLDRLAETDVAIDHLRAVIAAKPAAPYGAAAHAQLQLGRALDRMGHRTEAMAAYNAAITAAGAKDPLEIGRPAREGLRRTPDPGAGIAYRLSLDGWRALERGDLDGAARALDASLALRPGDATTRYRQARLQLARENDDEALASLEAIVAARPGALPTVYASACVDAARLHERRGTRARAIELYRIAAGVFGADARTKEAARSAIARLAP